MILPAFITRTLALIIYNIGKIGIRMQDVDPVQLYLSSYKMYFDATKAIKEIGFLPRPVHASVSEALDWYQQYDYL
jgi:hypothetical protein